MWFILQRPIIFHKDLTMKTEQVIKQSELLSAKIRLKY